MDGSTNAQGELTQTGLGSYTMPITSGITASKSGIVLARIYGSSTSNMVYIRIDDSSDVEQRQYGSYFTADQQLMIPGFVRKGEKIRVTGLTGATCILYLVG